MYLVVQSLDESTRSQQLYNAQFCISVEAMLNKYMHIPMQILKSPLLGMLGNDFMYPFEIYSTRNQNE